MIAKTNQELGALPAKHARRIIITPRGRAIGKPLPPPLRRVRSHSSCPNADMLRLETVRENLPKTAMKYDSPSFAE